MELVRLFRYIKHKITDRFERKSFALSQLDKKLSPYLGFRKKGFFIEAGANDGIRQSNTLYFEKYYNWTGLLIEPIPELARRCAKNRPKCIVENCALVDPNYPNEMVEMVYCDLMSVVRESIDISGVRGQQQLSEGEEVYTTKVTARTLSEVLDEHRIEQVDLLSLDVEGYEPKALQGIDFDRHAPEFMLIEVRSQAEIAAVISHYYEKIAVLKFARSYSDILYRRISY